MLLLEPELVSFPLLIHLRSSFLAMVQLTHGFYQKSATGYKFRTASPSDTSSASTTGTTRPVLPNTVFKYVQNIRFRFLVLNGGSEMFAQVQKTAQTLFRCIGFV